MNDYRRAKEFTPIRGLEPQSAETGSKCYRQPAGHLLAL